MNQMKPWLTKNDRNSSIPDVGMLTLTRMTRKELMKGIKCLKHKLCG